MALVRSLHHPTGACHGKQGLAMRDMLGSAVGTWAMVSCTDARSTLTRRSLLRSPREGNGGRRGVSSEQDVGKWENAPEFSRASPTTDIVAFSCTCLAIAALGGAFPAISSVTQWALACLAAITGLFRGGEQCLSEENTVVPQQLVTAGPRYWFAKGHVAGRTMKIPDRACFWGPALTLFREAGSYLTRVREAGSYTLQRQAGFRPRMRRRAQIFGRQA